MKKAAIVGCGNIAGFLDTPESKTIVTHAHAYSINKDTHLIACCDPDGAQRAKFCSRWDDEIHAYESLHVMLEKESIDILSICSPTEFHAHDLKLALRDSNTTTIICEKPFVQTQNELDELLPLLQQTQKKILINYMRRYDPSIQELARLLKSKNLGEIEHFSGTFTKGLYHNGSHMLELIEHLCGEITLIKMLTCKDNLQGSFYLETTQTRGTLNNESGDNYALFEFDIILSKGRVRIKNAGHIIEIETLKPSQEYAGYYNLSLEKTLKDSMQRNIYNTLHVSLNDDTRDIFLSHLRLSQKLLDIQDRLYKNRKLTWEPQ